MNCLLNISNFYNTIIGIIIANLLIYQLFVTGFCYLSCLFCCCCFFNTEQAVHTRIYVKFAAFIVLIMGCLQLIFELFQFVAQQKAYLSNYSNYLDIILYISACIFSSSALLDCVCPNSWQWQVGSVAVFLAWINLLIYLRIMPYIGNLTISFK